MTIPASGGESLPAIPEPAPIASFAGGGVIPRSGVYRLEAGEVVVPREADEVEDAGEHWYLPLKPGDPIRAKANPDPDAYWRLAMTPQEAQAAIQQGDPAETPILAPAMVLRLPPRKRAAAAEFLRRRQYEDAQGTLLDVVQAFAPRTAMAPPTTGRGLAPARMPGSAARSGLPSVEESTDEAIEDYYRKQEGEKFPWGPHIPVGMRRLPAGVPA